MSAAPVPVTIPAPPRSRHSARGALAWAATGLALVLGAVMFVPAILGYERYVITGGSMTGTYDRGSVLFAEAVPPADLRVGDVITYDPPNGGPGGLVTHRIATIEERDGRRVYRTKGDANAAADPWKFTLPDPLQARAVFAVPYVGHLIGALSDRGTRMLVIGLPALLVALGVLAALWRDAGREARSRPDRREPEVATP
jgi:signal peptidase